MNMPPAKSFSDTDPASRGWLGEAPGDFSAREPLRVVGGIRQGTTTRLLRALAVSSRSGILTATHQHGEIELAVRAGEILYGRQSPGGVALGEFAVDSGHVSQGDLLLALKRQRTSAPERPLGSLLLEVGAISEGGLRDVLLQQANGAVRELLRWQRGFFRFASAEVYGRCWLGVGARLAEVMSGALEVEPVPSESPAPAVRTQPIGLVELFRSHDEQAEELLERLFFFVARTFEFGVLAVLEGERFFAVGGHGCAPYDAKRAVARRGIGSVLDHAIERREAVEAFPRGFEDVPLTFLRDRCPLYAMAFPLLVEGDVAAVLYCDSSQEQPLSHVGLLETVLRDSGIALERRLWQVRVARLEEQLLRARREREQMRQRYERLRSSAFDWGLMT